MLAGFFASGFSTIMAIISTSILILGSGCAGLTAAIYAARAGLEPIVLEGSQPGGQLTMTTDVENFPGFPEGVNGYELIDRMKQQAARFGAEFRQEEAKKIRRVGDVWQVECEEETYQARAVIVATGSRAKMLDVAGEQDYFGGGGVSVCATCDGAFYRGRDVAVIGGGDTALEEAIFLTRFCSKVYVIHRRDQLRASKIMAERAQANEKIQFLWKRRVERVLGDGSHVTAVRLENLDNGQSEELPCRAVFVAIGHSPNSDWASGVLERDEGGYFKRIDPNRTATAQEGIFIAGDCGDPVYRQAIVAAGMGAQAAIAAERYLGTLSNKENPPSEKGELSK